MIFWHYIDIITFFCPKHYSDSFLFFILCACMQTCSQMYPCVVHMCAPMYRDQKPMFGLLLGCCLFVEMGLLVNLEPPSWLGWVVSKSPPTSAEITCMLPAILQLWMLGIFTVGAGNPKLGLHACLTSTVLTASSSYPITPNFNQSTSQRPSNNL